MYLTDMILRYSGDDARLNMLRDSLADAELYSVEASACDLADDLRLEVAGQLEKIALLAGMLAVPRWIEWPTVGFWPMQSRIFGTPRIGFSQGSRRMGVLVIPTDNGATLLPARTMPEPAPRERRGDWRNKLIEAVPAAYHIRPDAPIIYKSPKEMTAAEWRDPLVAQALHMGPRDGMTLDQTMQAVWMSLRTISVGQPRPWPCDITPDRDMIDLDGGRWVTSVIAQTLAALAILALSAPEVERRRRRPEELPREMRQATDAVDDRLSIVTLRIDPERRRTGETAAQYDRRIMGRHFVRGHLFLARNGKMVWRRPHWRGDPNKRVLHRVI